MEAVMNQGAVEVRYLPPGSEGSVVICTVQGVPDHVVAGRLNICGFRCHISKLNTVMMNAGRPASGFEDDLKGVLRRHFTKVADSPSSA